MAMKLFKMRGSLTLETRGIPISLKEKIEIMGVIETRTNMQKSGNIFFLRMKAWFLSGDFNNALATEYRTGSHVVPGENQAFQGCIDTLQLTALRQTGRHFTFSNRHQDGSSSPLKEEAVAKLEDDEDMEQSKEKDGTKTKNSKTN
ncbi:hypothetical protein H5410_041628 [Solanum commersonii]|uniref:Uncharacterized protein n=1 Tax=Solanum commersonii TaxID=4109 RepID=A0A9J5XTM9_SOLCO|nr:hypothetical protein H5410_041628 [Solanum commersonii]